MLDESIWAQVDTSFAELEQKALAQLAEQGVEPADRVTDRLIECRYVGQEHAIAVAVDAGMTAQTVGSALQRAARAALRPRIECACAGIDSACAGNGTPGEAASASNRGKRPAPRRRPRLRQREAYCFAQRGYRSFGVYERSALCAGDRIEGPAIIDEGTSTTVVHSDQTVLVDEYGNLIIRARAS